ncbi:hypothetical protein [Silanimonas sp.]|jgi:hypothetical protein|uniref:hypothetical protein n=1 Tax=Silanimonas sp. TaxID=1929290 RepID=UPI0022BC258E|nr:hypothetical protein [Silanimonas sp.]MCZ8113798.1 hypothetical protein [Silanimonas sp.]
MPREARWRLAGALLMLAGSALAFGAAAFAFMANGPIAIGFAIGALVAMLAGGVAVHQANRTVPAPSLEPADRRRIGRMALRTLLIVVGLPLTIALGLGMLLRTGNPPHDSETALGNGLRLLHAGTMEPATPRDFNGHARVVFLESGMPALQIVLDEPSRAMVGNITGGPWWLAKDGETLVLLSDATILASPEGSVITQPSWVEADALRVRLGTATTR